VEFIDNCRDAPWMLYGAYGKTGRLVLDEALRRGHRPVLAGRDDAQLAALGRITGLATRCVSLDDTAAMREALSGLRCVVLAAGPYQLTGPAMRRACVDAGCSYLDINGELDDFVRAMACDRDARAAGIAIIAGVGYGVVFGECLAAQMKSRLPGATSLRLSLATKTLGRSRAATLSAAAIMTGGGRDVYHGTLRTRPIASPAWTVRLADGTGLRFAGAPLAELVAVQRSTGIPNVSTGIPLSRTAATVMRVGGPVLGRILAKTARASTPAQPPATVDGLRSRMWAHAADDGGRQAAAMLETGEGYRAAAVATVRAVESLLQTPRIGALTPVQAFGADFALSVPGTRIQQLER
jgi:short subunit dehydrogenase-like uncharacterized protein